MPKRSASSQRWLQRQRNDPFAQQARDQGLRSRASFKLQQLQTKDHMIQPGDRVLDLGAAPGGWTLLAKRWVGPSGCVVACDLLPMEPVPTVPLVQGDFTDPNTQTQLHDALGHAPPTVVLCDMAPNTQGVQNADQWRAMALADAVLAFTVNHLAPQGRWVIKLFQGQGFDDFVREARSHFAKVLVRKPEASRASSREVYLVGWKA